MGKKTVSFFVEFGLSILAMSDENAGALFKAAFAHEMGEDFDMESCSDVVKAVLPLMLDQLDRMDAVKESRARSGSIGGSRSKNEQTEASVKQEEAKSSKPKQTEASVKQTQAPTPIPVYNTSPDGEDILVHPEPEEEPDEAPSTDQAAAGSVKASFEEAWAAYPKKQGRKAALAAYKRAIRDGTKHEDIMAGIERYKAYLAREKIGDQYVKMGSTFFNGACWEDTYGETKRAGGFTDTRGIDYDQVLRSAFFDQFDGDAVGT